MALFDKLLVANRGEIALRIIKSAKLLGIKTVAIYTESEKEADYTRMADETVSLGNDDLNATFLNISRIIEIAIITGSTAIHPGYGFLSENPEFALACEKHHIIFIGPPSEVLRLMGNKPGAKKLAASLGIPVIADYQTHSLSELSHQPIAFPVLIKASHGGGGKGMKIVNDLAELEYQVNQSSRLAMKYFGNGDLFIEQFIPNARHVEVQIIGDKFGHIIHLYERECSIQRKHQKILEEAPAVFLSAELREKLLSASLEIGKALQYEGAGTVEFLVDESGNYFFIEMNPRIQVEHAVTEQITGIDIVAEQLKAGAGIPLSISQDQVIIHGHAIEIRVYSENPAENFRPSSQALLSVNLPDHPDIRIEADMASQYQVSNQFDPLLLKLIAWGKDRSSAISLLRESLSGLNIIGPQTNAKYLEKILAHKEYEQNNISVEFCKKNHNELVNYPDGKSDAAILPYFIGLAIDVCYLGTKINADADPWKYLGYWRVCPQIVPLIADGQNFSIELSLNDKSRLSFALNGSTTWFSAQNKSEKSTVVTIGNVSREIFFHTGNQGEILISLDNYQHRLTFTGLLSNHPEAYDRPENVSHNSSSEVTSPLHGKITEIYITENQIIKKGDPLLVIEAMKSENRILSHRDAKVKKVAVKVGTQVTDRMPLIYLED